MSNLRIGVFGVGRGMDLAESAMLNGAEVVAICDFHKERREAAIKRLGKEVAVYEDFDSFIEHPMDGVILANYFHQHAPYAIKCMERGIPVFSECISNGTMAEGVALARAAEKYDSIYMLGENYPFMRFNREMKRVCDGGTLGKYLFAEGEYNHPIDPRDIGFQKRYIYFKNHWRNFLPKTYYITHSLGPLMYATGATPKVVSAAGAFAPITDEVPNYSHSGDLASVTLIQNDDGSIFRVTGWALFGAHGNSYRIAGTRGQIENLRGMGDQVMLRYNHWETPEGCKTENLYTPVFDDKDEEASRVTGHGGADFFCIRTFLECIKENKQPPFPFDVYSAIVMSSVAILSHRSILDGGKPYRIPDFRNEEDRVLYENDYITPFPGDDGTEPTIRCCSVEDFKPTEKQVELYEQMFD